MSECERDSSTSSRVNVIPTYRPSSPTWRSFVSGSSVIDEDTVLMSILPARMSAPRSHRQPRHLLRRLRASVAQFIRELRESTAWLVTAVDDARRAFSVWKPQFDYRPRHGCERNMWNPFGRYRSTVEFAGAYRRRIREAADRGEEGNLRFRPEDDFVTWIREMRETYSNLGGRTCS